MRFFWNNDDVIMLFMHMCYAYVICACVHFAFFKLQKFRTVVTKLKKCFSSFDMTPPAKWFLDREDNFVFVCTSTSVPDSTNRVDRQGFVRDIKTGLAKGKSVLKVIVRPYTHQCLPVYTFQHYNFFLYIMHYSGYI